MKVEATKFTEVGYVGRDVDSIIRDLVENAVKMLRADVMEERREQAKVAAEERILDALLTPARETSSWQGQESKEPPTDTATRQLFRRKLHDGELDDKDIEVDVRQTPVGVEIMAPPGMEEMTSQLQNMFSKMGQNKTHRKRMKVAEAKVRLLDEEAAKLVNEDELKTKAIHAVEQNGIVFLDEIDKVARGHERGGADVSREGVQRDLLPLIEGTTVSTRYGMVKTDHVLFIASGAFHLSKPSDLIPELQGRLPIRVELSALTADDFERILTEPDASLTEQYRALLATEGLSIEFSPDCIKRLAEVAWQVNEKTENIGARRLHTVMERLLEEISFEADDLATQYHDKPLVLDAAAVERYLGELAADEDLSRYIL